MSGHTLDELPDWIPGTACVLATVDAEGRPHAIPMSTPHRAGPKRITFALGPTRGSAERLHADGRAALVVMTEGVALTAEGTVRRIAQPLDPDGRVDGYELVVEEIWDHNGPTFAMDAPVGWHWADDDAEQGDLRAHEALGKLP